MLNEIIAYSNLQRKLIEKGRGYAYVSNLCPSTIDLIYGIENLAKEAGKSNDMYIILKDDVDYICFDYIDSNHRSIHFQQAMICSKEIQK